VTTPTTTQRPGRGVLTRPGFRLPFLVAGGLALLGGLDAGLALLGLPPVYVGARLAEAHGPLMVLGFVGTLISLERAVALGRAWAYLAPAASAAGAIGTILGLGAGPLLLVLAQVLALLVYRALLARQPAPYIAVQVLGQTMGLAGAFLWWVGVPVTATVPWLVGFLVLTILGERIELSRLDAPSPRAQHLALGLVALLLLAATASLLWPEAGFTIFGVTLAGVAAWLGVNDVARRTIRAAGLPRFIAACLLAGYLWLAVGGALWAVGGQVTGRGYDAAVHAVLLGFVLSMIMAHAPVILPAVLRRPLPYHPGFIAPAALLQASLLLRIAVGDARDLAWAAQAGGAGNVVAVLGFVVLAAAAAIRAAGRASRAVPEGPAAPKPAAPAKERS